jgi:hypothetical protein
MKFKNFLQKSFYYFLISGVITLLAIIYNYILIEFLKVNLNLTFLTSFFIFGFLSYAGNSIFNFKQKILLKKYFLFMQNILTGLVFTLILANSLDQFSLISNLTIVIISTIFNAVFNFLINLKYTFKFF